MLPGGQAVHAAMLAFLYEPKAQGAQVGTPAASVTLPSPEGHSTQVCAPVDAAMDPAGHALQAASPGALKCCSGQGVQLLAALAPGGEVVPGRHWLHTAELAPCSVPKKLAGHCVQAEGELCQAPTGQAATQLEVPMTPSAAAPLQNCGSSSMLPCTPLPCAKVDADCSRSVTGVSKGPLY